MTASLPCVPPLKSPVANNFQERSLHVSENIKDSHSPRQRRQKILKNELIPFTRQTASMLNAGMSILAAVSTLEDQCAHPGFKRAARVAQSIEEWHALF